MTFLEILIIIFKIMLALIAVKVVFFTVAFLVEIIAVFIKYKAEKKRLRP